MFLSNNHLKQGTDSKNNHLHIDEPATSMEPVFTSASNQDTVAAPQIQRGYKQNNLAQNDHT